MSKNDPRKALGKGLHALLPARNNAAPPVADSAPTARNAVQAISIQHLAPNPDQPRRDFEPTALMELTRSIERDGIIQPIIVRRSGATEFQIIAGERRWRAAKAAGLTEVPVIVRTADDQQVLELALVVNREIPHVEAAELSRIIR